MPPTKKTLSSFWQTVIGIDLIGLVAFAISALLQPDYRLLHFGNGLIFFAVVLVVMGASRYVNGTRDPREGIGRSTRVHYTSDNIEHHSEIMSDKMSKATVYFQRLGAAAVLPFIVGVIVRMIAGG